MWNPIPVPHQKNIIGTKWVFINKLNEQGEVRNKARLVAQGYSQQEGINFSETFAPVARLEAIILLLSYAINHDIVVYKMDANSAFLNIVISEEAPFSLRTQSTHFFLKLKKSLHKLK